MINDKLFYLIMLILILQSAVYAYRPFTTEDAGIAQLGENKVELGFESVGISKDLVASNNFVFLTGIGLGKAEIMFETPYCVGSTVDGEDKGLQDFVIAAKLRVAGKDDTGVALKSEYAYKSCMYGLSGVLSYSLNWVLIHMQAGWLNDSTYNGFFGGVGLDYLVLNRLHIILDTFVEHVNDTTCYHILAGSILSINDNITLDASVGVVWLYQLHKEREYVATIGCSLIL